MFNCLKNSEKSRLVDKWLSDARWTRFLNFAVSRFRYKADDNCCSRVHRLRLCSLQRTNLCYVINLVTVWFLLLQCAKV